MIRIIFACAWAARAFASDQIPDVDMHAMTSQVMALQRYLFSEAEFSSPKNESAIKESLPVLEKHLARLRDKVFTDQPALRSNVSMLSEQVTDADRAFREGDKAYARYVLVSSLQLCVACHTRTASPDFELPDGNMPGASTLDKANYCFATRQFDKGRALYEKFLSSAGKKELPGLVRSASLALAIYYARVKRDPRGGEAYFLKLGGDNKFTPRQRDTFLGWAQAFHQWAPSKTFFEAMSDQEAMAQARKLLAEKAGTPADEIRELRAASLLSTVLEGPGETSPMKAEALLSLGKVYESLQFPLYYRFGDMYLKACIADYKKTKEAQRCYDALDEIVKGRVGKDAASMEEADLLRWKKLAY